MEGIERFGLPTTVIPGQVGTNYKIVDFEAILTLCVGLDRLSAVNYGVSLESWTELNMAWLWSISTSKLTREPSGTAVFLGGYHSSYEQPLDYTCVHETREAWCPSWSTWVTTSHLQHHS